MTHEKEWLSRISRHDSEVPNSEQISSIEQILRGAYLGMSQNVFQSREKLDVEIFEDSSEASYVVAQKIADLVRSKEEKGRS